MIATVAFTMLSSCRCWTLETLSVTGLPLPLSRRLGSAGPTSTQYVIVCIYFRWSPCVCVCSRRVALVVCIALLGLVDAHLKSVTAAFHAVAFQLWARTCFLSFPAHCLLIVVSIYAGAITCCLHSRHVFLPCVPQCCRCVCFIFCLVCSSDVMLLMLILVFCTMSVGLPTSTGSRLCLAPTHLHPNSHGEPETSTTFVGRGDRRHALCHVVVNR